MLDRIDNLPLFLSTVKTLLVILPIIGIEVFFVIKDKSGRLIPKFALGIFIIHFAFFAQLQLEIYSRDKAQLLQKTAVLTNGTVTENKLDPRGHGLCLVTYQYEVMNPSHKLYSQEISTDRCDLIATSSLTVWYSNTEPVVSSISNRFENYTPPLVGDFWRIYLVISTILVLILLVLHVSEPPHTDDG